MITRRTSVASQYADVKPCSSRLQRRGVSIFIDTPQLIKAPMNTKDITLINGEHTTVALSRSVY